MRNQNVQACLLDLGCPPSKTCRVRELWTGLCSCLRSNAFARGVGATMVMLSYITISSFLYACASHNANKIYLEWAEKHHVYGHLPDMLLDLHPNLPKIQNVELLVRISDLVPTTMICICLVLSFAKRDLANANALTIAQSIMYLLNMVAENITVLPSSYGYRHCLAYLQINNSSDAVGGFSLSNTKLSGSCAAMIWSGHTVGTILGIYYLLSALRVRRLDAGIFCGGGPSLKVVIALMGSICEASLLLGSAGHYSIDCFLSMLITPLIVTHPSFSRLCFWANPFLTPPEMGKGLLSDASIGVV